MNLPRKRIITLFGGPGVSKSTTCAGLFYHLKLMGYETEMIREYVKNWIWTDTPVKTGDQTHFFAETCRMERNLMEKELDFIVSDSPLLLTHFYGMKYDWLEQNYNTSKVLLEHHHGYCKKLGYKIDHFFLERAKAYSPKGRFQTEAEAKQCDVEIKDMLDDLEINYSTVRADRHCVSNILSIMETFE